MLTATAVSMAAGIDFNFTPGRYNEFIANNKNDIILFPVQHSDSTRIYRNGKWHDNSKPTWEGRICDVIQTDNAKWYLLSETSSKEAIIYEWKNSSLKLRHRLNGLFEKPALHDTGNGQLQVSSHEGRLYTAGPTGTLTHAFGPGIKKGNCYSYYPTTLSLKTKNAGTWFWSHIEHEAINFGSKKPAIKGFHVYRNNTWNVVSNIVDKLGGVVEIDDNTLCCGTRYKGFLNISTASGSTSNLNWKTPKDEHCIFLHSLGKKGLLAITARPSKFMRLPPQKQGRIGTLLSINNGKVRTLLNGVDMKKVYHDKGRPAVNTPAGTFLATANDGLIFVDQNAQKAHRINWRQGLPVSNIERMRLAGDNLMMLDRERGFVAAPWRQLINARPLATTKHWQLTAVACPPTTTSDGAVWYLTADIPATLCCEKNGVTTKYKVPEKLYSAKNLWYLACDSYNRIWFIGDFRTDKTIIFDKGNWLIFASLSDAYSIIAKEERHHTFRVGNPSQHCYPAFSGDGRVAYLNEWHKICFFDLSKWHTWSPSKETGHHSNGAPFYRKGALTVDLKDHFYQYTPYKWNEIHYSIKNPYKDQLNKLKRCDIPAGFPGKKCPKIYLKDNQGTIWAGSTAELYHGIDDTWVNFTTKNTPLNTYGNITEITVTQKGTVYFTLTGGNYPQLARYAPPASAPTMDWAKKPDTEINTANAHFSVTTATDCGICHLRASIDNNKWQDIRSEDNPRTFTFTNLTNGTHTIRIQAFDYMLRTAPELKHTFTVNRNYNNINSLIRKLSSKDYTERETAANSLIKIGNPALKQLSSLNKKRPDLAWWIKAITQRIKESEHHKPALTQP
jgi:hypothetical protein